MSTKKTRKNKLIRIKKMIDEIFYFMNNEATKKQWYSLMEYMVAKGSFIKKQTVQPEKSYNSEEQVPYIR